MTFDIFNRKNENTGRLCTREVFVNVTDGDHANRMWQACKEAVAKGDMETYAKKKAELPLVTFNASFVDHKRANANAIPSGLFMLDIDHIPNMEAFEAEIVEPAKANAKQLGIVGIHKSPSQFGVHFICKCPVGMTTIEGCQRWLCEQLGIMAHDEGCTDFARGSFAVPLCAYYFIDWDGMFEDEPVNILPNSLPLTPPEGGESGNTGLPSLQGRAGERLPQQRTFTEEQKNFKYRDHLISEIAAKWVEKHGTPQQGERHTYYYRLCSLFRYITDGDSGVLLAQLPDFGMGIAEREKECQHACSKSMGSRIPYAFFRFLAESRVIETDKTEKEKIEIILSDEDDSRPFRAPWLPVVFREFCKNCPPDFVYPSIVALLPVLGTLATRLRATYLDGREHSTSFISVIFSPQSAGKSFARDIVATLTKDLRAHDSISILKEKQYKAELKLKKNSDQLPEDPHAPYRLVQAVISVPRLLQRQEDACGLHQLSFTEEIDTITKSNSGGSYAQKSDLYRQAFDNAEYGQDYISVDTFTGSVKLYYNILMLGTPKQLYKFFTDAENGLVSRCAFAELQNQEFAPIPRFTPLSKLQLESITKVMNRFEEMTYRRKNAQSEDYTVKPTVNIDGKLDEVREALETWLEETRKEALKNNDVAFDIFRRRAAVKAFRLGMLCMGMYAPKTLTVELRRKIAQFCVWFAGMDAKQSVAAFGKMISETDEKPKSGKQETLLDALEETFNVGELIAAMQKRGYTNTPRKVLYRWKKAGYIKQNDDSTFTKIKK